MNQELIDMAKQAGFVGKIDVSIKELKAFAALVRADEREACAELCDVLSVHPILASDITKLAALAIRAREKQA
jgi:hypothetical protein